ncbi:helicase-exonuclease AddAB subunit AddB [Staphylococcus massiliensis]|uniref:helicase-exonuclease AddAB subunit AddB n=1 Tax=Staphylococcus massiliensis TaxID=555791 RepID=UPI001EE0F811|nr:helicase-exonuclease AddAB subunit AddB [Staphylococcus massiliensis]MCG3401625.1 helicase-exonuclease AddAB subunit AddB [Staphylococcus massiliensis]
MRLEAFIGRAGTGKTYEMMSEIKQAMQTSPMGDPIVVITPTQSTFKFEQAFAKDATLNGSLRTEILHFNRVAHRLFQEVGGLTEDRVSQEAMEMMIYDLLNEHQQSLKLYQSQVGYFGFSEKLSEQIQDFKKYHITPTDLDDIISSNSINLRTRDKFHDIQLIYDKLEARLKDHFVTNEDMLMRFIEKIPESKWLQEADIYIDGFHNFSTLEYEIIQALTKHCKSVTVLLTSDGNQDMFSLFRKPLESLQHLEDIAQDLQIPLKRRHFTQVQRYQNESLAHLEQSFDALQVEQRTTSNEVKILESSNMREEVNEVARDILRDLRVNHYRFNDIAILYRDPAYAYLLETILNQYDIPFNIDVKRSMTHHPFMEMLRSLVEVIQKNWAFEPMMRLLKTNILTSTFKDHRYLIDIIENYAIERGIHGSKWLDDRYFTVDQFERLGIRHIKLNDARQALFEKVIKLKDDVVKKLHAFEQALREGQHATAYATALYNLIEEFELPHQMMTQRDELDLDGKHKEAEEIDQVWHGFIRVLDDMVTIFKDKDMGLTRFLEILDIGLSQLEFKMIPQGVDEVTIGTMDLAKVANKKHIYMIGMNDGVMPQTITNSSLISDDEKKQFQTQSNVKLSPTADILQMDEAFVCYIAMAQATEKVTFSYSLMGMSGDDKEKSPFLDQIEALYFNLEVQNIHHMHEHEPLRLMEHPHQTKISLFEALKGWLNDEIVAETWLDAYQVIRDDEHLNQGLDHLMTSLSYSNETVQLDQSLTEKLYGTKIEASVSRFEGFKQCPFKHYASHGLKLNERTKYQLQSFDLGSIFHDVLRYISERVEGNFKQLTERDIQALTKEALDLILPEVQFNLLNSTAHYQYMSHKIGAIIKATVSAMQYQGSHTKFKPYRFEQSFKVKPRHNQELKADVLYTKQGYPIYIRGQIDRIDTYQSETDSFVNIIDYKSSKQSAELDLKKVYYGMQMQMMTYMDIVLQNYKALNLSESIRPGGLLYMRVHEPIQSFKNWVEHQTTDIDQARLKSFQMKGLINQDERVIQALDVRDEASYKSDIVPFSRKKNGGFSSNSKVADESVIHKLIQKNKENFIETASDIMDGETKVAPLQYENTLPCRFCNYKSVCHVDGIIDKPRYRQVDETINPIALLQEDGKEDNHDS